MSEFLRRAAAERSQRTLAQREQLADVIGAVRSEGGAAAQTGEAFADLLEQQPHRR